MMKIKINYGNNIELNWSDSENFIRIFNLQVGKGREGEDSDNIQFRISENVNNFMSVLGSENFNNVLDIGSGISIFDMILSKLNPHCKFSLLDKSKIQGYGKREYYSKENLHGFYNDWSVVKDCINSSNLNIDNFSFLDVTDEFPNNLDLVISTASWCWHYPKEVYWSSVMNSLRPGGKLIINVLYQKDRDIINEISNELGSIPRSMLIPKTFLDSHPNRDNLENILSVVDGNIGGLFCWTKK